MSRYDDDRRDERSERRGPPDIVGLHSIKIDNLAYETSKNYIEGKFGKFGRVGDVYVPQNRDTGKNRGFAFVRYYDKRDADDAIYDMDGKEIDGRSVRISHASARAPRGGGRGGYGGGGGRDGGGRRRSRSRSPQRSRSRSPSPRKSRSFSHSASRSPRR